MLYEQVIDELIQNKITTPDAIYNFGLSPVRKQLEDYFTFCQQNLLLNEKELNIQPARFFYENSYIVNGFAGYQNNYYIIKIPYDTIDILWMFFTNHNSIFRGLQFERYTKLDPHLDSSIIVLMFQCATNFTFYHERAHLVQMSGNNDFSFTESYAQDGSGDYYSLMHHIYEIDADASASHFCVLHLLQYWNKLALELKTSQNLHLILSFGISSVIVYFIFLLGKYGKEEVYYKRTLHPHPVIRIRCIADIMVGTVHANGFALDNNQLLKDAIELSEAMFLLDGENKMKNFAETLLKESNNIRAYLNELIEESKKYKNLVHINR